MMNVCMAVQLAATRRRSHSWISKAWQVRAVSGSRYGNACMPRGFRTNSMTWKCESSMAYSYGARMERRAAVSGGRRGEQ